MTTYSIVLFFHFVGMAALFVGYGLEWTASTLLPRSSTAEQARVWLRVYRASLPISGPGLLLLIVTGGYLAALTGGMNQGWIIASFTAIIFALAVGFLLVLPRMRAIRAGLAGGDVTLPKDSLARLADPVPPTVIRSRFLLAVGIVYLMTVKPPLTTSIIVLIVALIFGILLAAPSWSRRST
jgi:hypothetical protein